MRDNEVKPPGGCRAGLGHCSLVGYSTSLGRAGPAVGAQHLEEVFQEGYV